ncbi:MAG: glycine betaine ABC transporter substrate-binding protein [Actinomycetota bacterium]|nr:glycine betaine ABC transporter substrate-binding protein [Actinomycetota bacterium]HZY64355.1 glycine betaine ABC transporter substrate-binding protein [Rubrobacteraceae bacterium]
MALVLALGLFVSGCGAFGSARQLSLEHMGWDENVAVSTLTKVLLEEELGYEVELKLAENLDSVFEDVANGESDAFQDVWLPNHEQLLEGVEDDVELLEPWFEGETSYGIAVPYYMQVDSLAELDQAGTDQIIGIEPRSAFHPQITREVIPAYDLDVHLVESSTPAMLAQLEEAYKYKEPIVFLAWSPHWMNGKYRLRYLKDPKDAQGVFNDPARISSIVRRDLAEDDPTAYEFLRTLSLSDEEVVEIELSINERGSRNPVRGVEAWVSQNREVVQPWVDAARDAEGA